MRSIAIGRRAPTPGRYGLSRATIASIVTTTTVVGRPHEHRLRARALDLSAKKSMYANTIPAVRKRTSQIESGMMPGRAVEPIAPASSRTEVWSCQRQYADCSSPSSGSVLCRVRNIATPHGLMRVAGASRPPSAATPGRRRASRSRRARRTAAPRLLGQELRGLELLADGERLGLGAVPRVVVCVNARKITNPAKIAYPVARTPKTPAHDRRPGR